MPRLLNQTLLAARLRPHMIDGKRVASATYNSWQLMKDRCLNPRCPHYSYYGGRGIRVADRWMSFDNFLADMGEAPPKMTLERKNRNGNYSKRNCVWACRKTQAQNRGYCRLTQKRANQIRRMYVRGVTRQVDIAKHFGISQCMVSVVIRGAAW